MSRECCYTWRPRFVKHVVAARRNTRTQKQDRRRSGNTTVAQQFAASLDESFVLKSSADTGTNNRRT